MVPSFLAPGFPFVKDITNYSDCIFGFHLPHNKFLQTPLCESDGLKQNTKL